MEVRPLKKKYAAAAKINTEKFCKFKKKLYLCIVKRKERHEKQSDNKTTKKIKKTPKSLAVIKKSRNFAVSKEVKRNTNKLRPRGRRQNGGKYENTKRTQGKHSRIRKFAPGRIHP